MHHWLDPATGHGAAWLDRIVNQQAQIVAYADDYVLLIMATVPAWLLLLMMRMPRKAIDTAARIIVLRNYRTWPWRNEIALVTAVPAFGRDGAVILFLAPST